MKKINTILIFALSLFYFSCEKEEIDYREQYVGEYLCDNSSVIEVVKRDDIPDVNIHINAHNLFLYLDESGFFYQKIYGFEETEGRFSNDTLYLNHKDFANSKKVDLICIKLK